MKITATRYEDLRKAREDYDAETKKLSDEQSKQEADFRRAQKAAVKDIEKKVSDLIGPSSLQLEINADPWGHSLGEDRWRITVRAHEYDKFDNNVALSWNWEIGTDNEGNIIKDSGSWSGLKATTPEQVADLEESVRVIKLLNNADWSAILNSPNPEFYDYIDKGLSDQLADRRRQRPEFENEIVNARLEDLVGKDVAIKLSGDEYFHGQAGIILTGLTDKFLKGYIFPWRLVDDQGNVSRNAVMQYTYNEARRTSRNKIMRSEGLPIEAIVVE